MTRRLLALALLLAPAAARADHSFILPSSTSYSGTGNTATFDAAGSDHVFFFDHRPLQLGSVRVTRPDGTPGEGSNGAQGRFRSVMDVRLDRPGTWKVSATQVGVNGSFRLGGEERRVGGRPGGGGPPGGPRSGGEGEPRRQPPVGVGYIPAEATDVHLREMVSRTETFVTVDGPTTTVFKPTGQGLELDPITHPNTLVAGEVARFRFLLDGRPAAGIAVTVLPGGDRYRNDAEEQRLTTGADGTVAIRWPAAGMMWVGAETEDHHPAEQRAEVRRLSYAATLEVMTP